MAITYTEIDGMPDKEVLEKMKALHIEIFGLENKDFREVESREKLRIELAYDDEKIIGYKIGYPQSSNIFYSFLGGVEPSYRKHGIAGRLMTRQHEFIKGRGYTSVRTQTKNKWRPMLILNIKSGFDIIGTFTDHEGKTEIILEKMLSH